MTWDEWREQRRLKKLWIDPRDAEVSAAYMERATFTDAMPELTLRRPPAVFRAERWITAHREMPAVKVTLEQAIAASQSIVIGRSYWRGHSVE